MAIHGIKPMREIMMEKAGNRQGGFTLVEIMIALLISSIVMISIYAAFQSQQRSYLIQEQVAEMQQNIRISLAMITKDIRSAGYNPTDSTSNFIFVDGVNFDNSNGTATANVNTNDSAIAFTADLDEDGDLDLSAVDVNGDSFIDMAEMEQVAYRLNGTDLQRYSSVTGIIIWQTIAENIEQVEFLYTREDGTPLTPPLTAAELAQIRSVQISILAKAGKPDRNFVNTVPSYTTASGGSWDVPSDGCRRRLLICTVQCRNMGLK
jgi:type IV pilus assembly protein PilW